MKEELKLFEDYIKNYDRSIKAIDSKYHHTFRVIDYSTQIAKSLNLSEEDTNICKICALFHDIGRFPQYMKYQSYDDYETCDHGDLGEKVLKELGYNNEIVLKAVKYHNKVSIPNNLTERESMFCKILRDADKIDIMLKQANVNKDEVYYIDDYNKNRLLNNRLLEKIDSKNSCLVIYKVTAFIFDVNYKKTFEILKKEDIVNKKMKLIIDKFPNEEAKELENHFNKYLEEKLLS